MKNKIYYLHKGDKIPFYVGKTVNPKDRLAHHYQKYPKAKMEILREVGEDWKHWEQYYIKKYTILGFKLTNGNKGGGGPNAGRPHTWGNKISKAILGNKYSKTQLENVIDGKRKHINQYTEEGDMIKTWYATLTEIASEFNNKSSTTLNQHMKGKLKHAYGFIWSLA